MPTSKLASTFVLALVEEKSTPLNFLYFSTQLSLTILAKQSKTAKNACISLLNIQPCLFTRLGSSHPNKSAPFRIASIFVPALVEETFMPLYHCIIVFFYTIFHEDFGRLKIILTTSLQHVFVWSREVWRFALAISTSK